MDTMLTQEQLAIRESIGRVCGRFGDPYWLERDRDGVFPRDFVSALAADGWIGIAMPTEHGGSGLGILEAAVMMQAIAESGAAMSGASAVHLASSRRARSCVTERSEQKRRFLPPIIAGRDLCSFAVTEPDAGLDTARIKTMAVRAGDRYVIKGQKVWTSLAQVATKILILARTTPLERCAKPTDGMSFVLHRIRPRPHHGARDREDGPAHRRFRISSSSTIWRFRSPTASARKAKGSAISSRASIRSAS